MHAKITQQKPQTKTNYYTSKTGVEEKPKSKETSAPAKLRRNTATHVAASQPSPYTRRPHAPINLRHPQPIHPKDKKISLTPPIKKQKSSPVNPARMGSSASNPRGKITNLTNQALISGRQATTARVGPGPSGIQARLKNKSPWFSAIMEPIKGGGVKIPDAIGTDTGTYQHVENFSVNVNAQGIAGCRILSPYINNYTYGSPIAGDGINYQQTGQSGTTGNLAWGTAATPGTGGYPFSKVPAMMKSAAQSHRVVSASLICQPEVSTLSDAGEMVSFVKPFDANPSLVSYATLQSQWDSAIMPVNQHKPMISRWYPVSSDFDFHDSVDDVPPPDGVGPGTISYVDFIDPEPFDEAAPGVIPFEVGVVCTGMTPSTGVVRFQMVINYEFIPKTESSMIACEPSVVDPTEEQLVCNWVSDCPLTGPVSTGQAASPPMQSVVAQKSEPSGFGMLFNVVEEMMPMIKGAMSLL